MIPKRVLFSCLTLVLAAPAFAFNSGSTGADGPFTPTLDPESPIIEVELPPDGIFNYTDVNIPAGMTVTFKKNAANTPVYILASGNIIVAGSINVNAKGQSGGPGGYDGGLGGRMFGSGGAGKGPGGGNGGQFVGGETACHGAWGGYGNDGLNGYCSGVGSVGHGVAYGSANLVPLIGGSGGGGRSGTSKGIGYSGTGGGGALLMAASGKISITGSMQAHGAVATYGGGHGSGGAIRLVAATIEGNGGIEAYPPAYNLNGVGRIRLEADVLLRTAQTWPNFTFSSPREVFAAGLPTLHFVSVAGIAAPASPTGDSDISLKADIGNPVTIELAASGVPLGSTIKVLSAPEYGLQSTATSTPLSGSESAATATAQVNIADGKSTLIASVGFTVTAALGKELAPYANGETVARVELSTGLQGGGETKLITASGKEYLLPATAKAVLAQ